MTGEPVRFGLWYDFRHPAPRSDSFESFYAACLDQIVWAEKCRRRSEADLIENALEKTALPGGALQQRILGQEAPEESAGGAGGRGRSTGIGRVCRKS